MNLKSLVVVAIRLLALNFLLQVAIALAPQLLRFTDLYQRSPNSGEVGSLLGIYWFVIVAFAGAAILLWTFALPIARTVTSDLPQELSLGALSLADCYSIAFMGVGLSYIVSRAPGILNWSHFILRAAATHAEGSWKEKVNWYEVMQAFLPCILGIILFVNGRKWAIALARRQPETAPPMAPPDTDGGAKT